MGTVSSNDYEFLSKLLERVSGLSLGVEKEFLVQSRLMPLCRSLEVDGIHGLVELLSRTPNDSKLIKSVNDLMTTNESFFFRDITPFELLRGPILDEFRVSRQTQKYLSIWSAACSSGQEPYSIAMTLLESGHIWSDWLIKIVATDFSETMLQRARSGFFSDLEVSRGMSPELLKKYFDRVKNGWTAKPILKSRVDFQFANLMEPIALPKFDIIFLRNVLIYFSNENKTTILSKMAQMAMPDAVLLLGSAESAILLTDKWNAIPGLNQPIYRRSRS